MDIHNIKVMTQAQCHAAAAIVEALGMLAENQQASFRGETQPYTKENFDNLILNRGLGWNEIQSLPFFFG